MPLNHDIDAILVRYFSGQLSGQERRELEDWIRQDPARAEQLARLRAMWDASGSVVQEPDIEGALAQLKQRIAARLQESLPSAPAVAQLTWRALTLERSLTHRRRAAIHAWRIAAGLVLLVGAGLVWRSLESRSPVSDVSRHVRTYATARAERAMLTLPDGSVVMLNNETTLEAPASFGAGSRDVYLRGEAYFQVAHDSTRPFRVHAARAVTQVLGTRFDVRARPDEGAVQVVVAEGRVALRTAEAKSSPGVVLTRGELGSLSSDGRTSVVHGIDAARMLGWTEGRLAFERTPLPDVLAELSRWYDREFALGDSTLGQLRLTTSLRGDSIAEAIQVLEAALDVKAEIVGRKVVLHR